VLLLESPSLAEATEQELAAKKTALLEPGSLRENPSVICLFEGQYGAVRAISAHPRLNLFALGGDSGKLSTFIDRLSPNLGSQFKDRFVLKTFGRNNRRWKIANDSDEDFYDSFFSFWKYYRYISYFL
jgi:hypothetical protein